jgi:hypothetical protein
MTEPDPPPISLPAAVLDLMHRTIELAELLYWWPVPTVGSRGENIMAQMQEMRGDAPIAPGSRKRNKRFRWPSDWDLGMRRAYGRALMSGSMLPCLPSSQSTKFCA